MLLLLGLLVTLSACTSSRPYIAEDLVDWEQKTPPPDSGLVYQVFLVGNAGGNEPRAVLEVLQAKLATAGEDAAVVFLGDNASCCGLPDSGHVRRPEAEARLRTQLDAVKDFEGRVVFIPGDRDWNNSARGGTDAVENQQAFVEAYLDRDDVFLPKDGFPGPAEVKLTDRIRLLALDTAWWLYPHDKPYGDTGEYDLDEDANFLLELDELIKKRDDEDLLIVGHHPLLSNGEHAGRMPISDHVFPLRRIHPALVVPLPLVGSLYPLSVRFLGGRQDLAHPRYRALREALMNTFAVHERLVYAAAHENNLQYFYSGIPETPHYLISGSGSKAEPVGRGGTAQFTYGGKGFSTIRYYSDGAAWLDMWAAEDEGRLLFRTQLLPTASELLDPEVAEPVAGDIDYSDSTKVIAANPAYRAGGFKTFFLGDNYREAWATPIEVPALDLGKRAGGLTPIKRGGGLQTTSVRFEGGDGHEYVLRTIDKDPSGTVPVNLQGTVATDLVQDQISTLNPYGAFIIPPLAEAIGIYHTNPEPVYVPHDPRLGIYKEVMAGRLVMFEERPKDDQTDVPSFGRSEDVISDTKMYSEITDDNDHRVDQRFFARARLLDMLISDWDRHEGQWRWASFEPYELDATLTGEAREQGKIYRPIPRDHDFAFNKMDGLITSKASFFDPKFQDFDEGYGSLKGLNLNGRFQDHRLLNKLDREDWIEIADSVRAALTDEVIEAAVARYPDAIYERIGPETIRLLKLRREKLTDVAERFYHLHARTVDVVGSNKHERFEVTRLNEEATEVVVLKTSKEGEIRNEIYRRTFYHDETNDIRLYGLDGNDQFIVTGNVRDGLLVRAIGGPGEDTFVDRSAVSGPRKRTKFYDTATGNDWSEAGPEARLVRSDDNPAVNRYNPKGFEFNATVPLAFFGSNVDDGLFIGGGVNIIRQGFRKQPYGVSHRIKGNIATKTQAFNLIYEGHYVDRLGPWDTKLDVSYFSPGSIRNFYGLGNETEDNLGTREFYQAELTQAALRPSLFQDLQEGASLRIGPTFMFTDVASEDRFVNVPQPGVSPNSFDAQFFAGAEAELHLETVDSQTNPTLGFRWDNRAALNVGVLNATDTYSRLATDLAIYYSPSLRPQVTLALRAGGAHNFGAFPFYRANTLGGRDNLRGFRGTRYAGRSSAYQNAELRLQLFRFSSYLAIGRAGVLGFLDNGRVWTDGERSKVWHQGYGGGLWFDMFDLFVLQGTAGFSEDDQTISVGLGFQY